MTLETKLMQVLETYHNTMSVVESKAEIDKEKVTECDGLSTKQLYSMLLDIRMEEIQRANEANRITVTRILNIMKEEN